MLNIFIERLRNEGLSNTTAGTSGDRWMSRQSVKKVWLLEQAKNIFAHAAIRLPNDHAAGRDRHGHCT